MKVPYTDLKVNVNSVFKQKWQAQWNACPDNKLFQINPTVGDFYVWTGLSRREEIVITRARIGHTYFTHSYLLNCLFGVLRRFQHCTGHITTGSWKGRGNRTANCRPTASNYQLSHLRP